MDVPSFLLSRGLRERLSFRRGKSGNPAARVPPARDGPALPARFAVQGGPVAGGGRGRDGLGVPGRLQAGPGPPAVARPSHGQPPSPLDTPVPPALSRHPASLAPARRLTKKHEGWPVSGWRDASPVLLRTCS